MTPRTDVDWVDVSADEATLRERLIASAHSRLPVGEGSADMMIGVVQTRELLADVLAGRPLDVRSHMRKAPIIPETMDALDVLEVLRDSEVPMALVHDEYGHFEGLVTPTDILEAIAGVFRSDAEGREPYAVRMPAADRPRSVGSSRAAPGGRRTCSTISVPRNVDATSRPRSSCTTTSRPSPPP